MGEINLYILRERTSAGVELFHAIVDLRPDEREFSNYVAQHALAVADFHWIESLAEAGIPGDLIMEAYQRMTTLRAKNYPTKPLGP